MINYIKATSKLNTQFIPARCEKGQIICQTKSYWKQKIIQLPEDRDIMREHTKSNGTIGNLKNGKVYWFKKGDHRAGRYERSEQTLNRLKEQIKRGRQRKTMEADSQGVSQKTSP